jgi:hypothetical protein
MLVDYTVPKDVDRKLGKGNTCVAVDHHIGAPTTILPRLFTASLRAGPVKTSQQRSNIGG